MNQEPQPGPSPRARGFFSWRTLRWGLVGLAILITIVGLLLTFENVRGKRAWEEHKRALQAQGEKFSIGELAPPPVPDDQNFALAPLLRPALNFTREAGHAVWRDSNALNRLNQMTPNQPSDSAETNRLSLGSWEKGTLANLEACARFYRGNLNYPQATNTVSAARQILVALGKFDPEIAELEKAAAECPLSRFPIEYDYEPAIAILLPHLQAMKSLSTLLQLRSIAALEVGLPNQAFSELRLGLRLADSIGKEPILIDHLVRIAMLGINLQTLCEGLARHAWNDAQLAALQKELGAIDLLAEYKLAMRGERAFAVSTLDYMRRQRFELKLSDVADGVPDTRIMSLLPSGWFYQNMRAISRMHQDFTLPVVDEKAHRVLMDRMIALEQETDRLGQAGFQPYTIFAKLLFPAITKSATKTGRMQAMVDAARVACALERYHLANARWPETLAALTPQFLANVPPDVIDGKLLRYRQTADGGYVLYSIGWNQADDGGELAWQNDKERTLDLTRGDWVWRYPAK
jgi:hypothetical protein